MSNYSSLKSAIDANIKANGRREITGPVLNAILNAVVNSLGDGYLFRGVAIPSTNPGTPDQNVAYLAITEGTYTHMGGLSVTDGELSVFSYNGAWSKIPLALVPTKTSQLDNDLRFVTSEEMGESLSSKQDTIQDLETIRSGAAAGATAYQKPSAGIPASDMTDTVQQAISFAESTEKRPYNSSDPDGMGYLVLKKNKTFAEQVTGTNTIYEIRDNFNLGNASVSVPSGCVFRFVGGSLSNGTLSGNPFRVVAVNDVSIFRNITFSSSYISNDIIFVDWFDIYGDGVSDNYASFKRFEVMINNKGGGHVVFGTNKVYAYRPLVIHITNINFNSSHYGLWFEHCKNLDIDLNGATLKVLGTNTALSGIINFFDCTAKLHDGILRGDRDVHDYTPYTNYAGEESTNFELIHNQNQMGGVLEINNVISEYVCGDGFIVGSATIWSSGDEYEGNYRITNCIARLCGRNGITCHSAIGVNVISDTLIHSIGEFGNMPGWNPKAGIDVEFEDGVGAIGDVRFINLTIYDCVNKTISTFTNTQVRSFVAENIYSEGLLQVSEIRGGSSKVVNSTIRETKNISYLIGGTIFENCNIVFTSVGHFLYNTKYYNCTIESIFESTTNENVIIDGEGDAYFENCDISIHKSVLRYFTFENCRVNLKQPETVYNFNGVIARNTIFEATLDDNNHSAMISEGNALSGKNDSMNFFGCEFKNFKGSSSTRGLHLSSRLDGSLFRECKISTSTILKGACAVTFDSCIFDSISFVNTTISKVLSLIRCRGDLYLGNGNASYRDQIVDCILQFNAGGFPSFNSYQHADINNSLITDGGSTTSNNSAADIVAKNSIFVFGRNYTSTNMVMEACNITGITEAQFNGTKKNCIFAVPFLTKGSTTDRPSLAAGDAGFQYYDSDLTKMILWNGSAWVNMDGSAMS